MVLFCQVLAVNSCNQLQEQFSYLPTSTTGQVVVHTYYTLSYSEKHEQPEWVAYILTKSSIEGNTKRKDAFRSDPEVTTGSAAVSDYKKSGYDRGHLCPAADMKLCKESMSETFFMSNMSPQTPSFNRAIWKNLEEKFRVWTLDRDTLYVVTGPVLDTTLTKTIGKNEVYVPELYYKIALDLNQESSSMIAFLMPNKKCEEPIEHFAVPVDSVEKITGIDFYPDLPDKEEEELESRVKTEGWF